MRNLPSRLRSRLRWEIQRAGVGLETLFATRWHDLVLARRNRVTEGAVPAGPRMAIYVIYPTGGLLDSHLVALDYIRGRGYAPVVVSNLPLDAAVRDRLRPLVHRLIERENFGYDFGAYRQGVLALADRLAGMEHLALLNDSVWFPAGAADWLAQAEALGVDYAGAVSNYALAPPEPEAFAAIDWDYDPGRPGFHYCSFALLMGRRVLADPGFLGWWRGLRLTDDKIRTVRRGEVGLSQWMLGRGFSHAATLDVAGLDRLLAGLDVAELCAVLAGLVIPEEAPLRAVKAMVRASDDGSEAWRRQALAFVLTAAARTGMAYALPALALGRMGGSFLKKSPLRLDPEGAAVTLDLLDRLEGPHVPVFRAEARAMARPKGG